MVITTYQSMTREDMKDNSNHCDRTITMARHNATPKTAIKYNCHENEPWIQTVLGSSPSVITN